MKDGGISETKKEYGGVWIEYDISESGKAAVWEQSLESGGVFTHSMARVFSSHTHRCQCRGVWQEYGQRLESSWLLPGWLPLPIAARVT